MKLKVLFATEIDVVDDSPLECDGKCNFFFDQEGVPYCVAFDKRVELSGTMKGYARIPQCLKAAGNHGILSKCLAGE